MLFTLPAKVAPELKQNADTDMGITKTCAVLGCDDCKNMDSIMFFRYVKFIIQRNNHLYCLLNNNIIQSEVSDHLVVQLTCSYLNIGQYLISACLTWSRFIV